MAIAFIILVLSFPTGPSAQENVGPDRVVYHEHLVFRSNGPFRQTAYTPIINDTIALEDDEIVTLVLTFDSQSTGLAFSYFATTVCRIVDDDCTSISTLAPIVGGCLFVCIACI